MLREGAAQRGNAIEYIQQVMENLRTIYAAIKAEKEIPAQVLLSKPAILHDARGRICPIHLDFINSAEVGTPIHLQSPIYVTLLTPLLQAFVAVLKVRFKDVGLRKIENGQFVLEDTRRKSVISLKSSWITVVRPGQHISMSMIFRRQQTARGSCPSCGESNEESEVDEVDW